MFLEYQILVYSHGYWGQIESNNDGYKKKKWLHVDNVKQLL